MYDNNLPAGYTEPVEDLKFTEFLSEMKVGAQFNFRGNTHMVLKNDSYRILFIDLDYNPNLQCLVDLANYEADYQTIDDAIELFHDLSTSELFEDYMREDLIIL